MNWRISMLWLSLAFMGCKQNTPGVVSVLSEDHTLASINYLIEAEELTEIIHKPNVKIIDFRKEKYFSEGHLSGALNIWRTDIEDSTLPYAGIMAPKEQIEALFSSLGIETEDTLIIYDDVGLCDASRLWWILQNYDYTSVRLLHGGLAAWKANMGSVSTEVSELKKSVFQLTKSPSMKYYISKDEMQKSLATDALILDTRTVNEFSGKRIKKGATKAGRIPNSMLIDWADAINYSGDKKMKSFEELEAVYSRLNRKKDEPILVYCHSGVRSAHTTFVLTQILGYKNVRNYDGSWIEWSYHNDLPIKKDSITILNQ